MVKDKFYEEIKDLSKKPLKKNTDKPIWSAVDKNTGKSLFTLKIAKDKSGLNPLYLSQIAIHGYTNDKIHKSSGLEYAFINEDYLKIFLAYLNYDDTSVEVALNNFCNASESKISRTTLENQKIIPTGRNRGSNHHTLNINYTDNIYSLEDSTKRIFELRKELGKLMFMSTNLQNTKWWVYLHGYQRHKLELAKENSWPLVKLVLSFSNINEEGQIVVKLDNTGIEHYDYIGIVDYQGSGSEILIINLHTVPYFGRQLNIKVHIGTGEGSIFLGQYLNYESDNHIISGTVVLERIVNDVEPDPKVYHIENLPEGIKEYNYDEDGVSRYILQYLHDRKKNFRRTPLRAGHDLHGLKNWLYTRQKEEE